MAFSTGRGRGAAKKGSTSPKAVKKRVSGKKSVAHAKAGAVGFVTPSPKLTKKAQRQAQKDDEKFGSALENMVSSERDGDAEYCKQQIDMHPEWIPFLKTIFRQGTFEKLMKKDEEEKKQKAMESEFGYLLHSRITKLDKVPMDIVRSFLQKVNPTINIEKWEDGALRRAFMFGLWADSSVSLPTDTIFRHEGPLLKALMQRYVSLGSSLASDMSNSDGTDIDLNLFSMGESMDSVTFNPAGTSRKLPGSKEMGWELDLPMSYKCLAKPSAFKGCTVQVSNLFSCLDGRPASGFPADMDLKEVTEAIASFEPYSPNAAGSAN